MLDGLFARAQMLPWAPCIIIIDEIEVLVPNRLGGGDKKDQDTSGLIKFLSRFGGANPVSNLYVVGATNLLSDIDPAMKRCVGPVET